MSNSADSDQLASEEANWSGSTLFAKAGYIWAQQLVWNIAPDKAIFFNWKVMIFFLISPWKRMLWYSLEVPWWDTSNEYPQNMSSRRNNKTFSTSQLKKST